ncbi:MAG: phosphopentomutase [Christensenellales bacterium]|jgi:phosphopentomutase
MTRKKVLLIVLDSAGVGEMPDAAAFGDAGADTIGHIIKARGLNTPNMDALGLRRIQGTSFYTGEGGNMGSFGKAAEKTHAKDTTCGHFELAGFIMDKPFKTYPNGFPKRVMDEFERLIGRGTLGNCTASGTQIINDLGDEHVRTGKPIIYTSADSVFQIAAHEEVIPLEELYRMCQIARELLMGEDLVGRIIARPFIGTSGNYKRTEHRRDFALPPEKDTVLNALEKAGYDVVGVGKIEDIFCKSGITEVDHTTNNTTGTEAAIRYAKSDKNGLVFVNLVDFDMMYGHRNDVEGYGAALEAFDRKLPEIIEGLNDEDLLIITADHGCDPSYPGTDHTREYIPLLVYGKKIKTGVDIGIRSTYADVAATLADFFDLDPWPVGTSFLPEIKA